MRIKAVYGVLAALFAAVLATTGSCGDGAEDEPALERGRAVVRLSLPASSSTSRSVLAAALPAEGEAARTLHPDMKTGWEYIVTFAYLGGQRGPEGTFTHDDLTISVNELGSGEASLELEVGEWAFTAYGRVGGQEVAVSAEREYEITPGGTTVVSLVLGPKAKEGSGYFYYDITLPEEEGVRGTLTLYEDRTGTTAAAAKTLDPGRNRNTLSLELETGEYLLTVTAEGPEGKGGAADIVHIYKGLDTRFTIELFPKDVTVTAFDLTAYVDKPTWSLAAPGVMDTVFEYDEQYTGSIAWYDEAGADVTADGVFKTGTVYTAVVTLTPNEEWTFAGVRANAFTHSEAAGVTNAADSGIVTIVFPETARLPVSVTFNGNGGTPASTTATVYYGFPYGELPLVSRTGYTFAGWWTLAGGGTQVLETIKVTETADHALYAHWTVNQYTLTYEPAGGTLSGGTAGGRYDYGTEITLPTSGTRTVYVLDGFTLRSGGYDSTELPGYRFFMPANDVTATAVWSLPPRELTYDAAGGTLSGGTAAGSVVYGETVTLPSSGTKTGHTLSGFTLSGGATDILPPGATFEMPNADVTATAMWAANRYTVTFDLAGGDGENLSVLVTYGQPYGTLLEPQRMQAEFQGWYTAAGERIEYDTLVTLTENHTLYAHWDLLVLVMFDSAGGDAPSMAQKIVRYGSGRTYGALAVAERDGYTREDGNPWYTERLGGEPVWATTPVTRTDDHTLYAHWTAKTFKVYYDENNGGWISESVDNFKTVTYGQPYGTLLGATDFAYTPPGYTFGGWYTAADDSGERVTAETIVTATAEHTIYAHWIQGSPPGAVQVRSITFSPSTNTLEAGKSDRFLPVVAPTDATNKTLTWSSGKTDVATVDATGRVTALKTGTALITASATDGSGVSGSYNLSVTAPTTIIIFSNAPGSGGTDTVTATLGYPMPAVTIPVMTNYTFQGYWKGDTQYYNADGTSARNWDLDNTKGAVLSAKWRGVLVYITFESHNKPDVDFEQSKTHQQVYYMEPYGHVFPLKNIGTGEQHAHSMGMYFRWKIIGHDEIGYLNANTIVTLPEDHRIMGNYFAGVESYDIYE